MRSVRPSFLPHSAQDTPFLTGQLRRLPLFRVTNLHNGFFHSSHKRFNLAPLRPFNLLFYYRQSHHLVQSFVIRQLTAGFKMHVLFGLSKLDVHICVMLVFAFIVPFVFSNAVFGSCLYSSYGIVGFCLFSPPLYKISFPRYAPFESA